jgi:GDP-4-dehydro-6-deoxy-D-mannose reductase
VLAAFALQVAEVESNRRAYLEVGNLDVVRDFTDVRDVVRAYRLLGERGQPGEIYNLGSGRGTRIGQAVDHLQSQSRKAVTVQVSGSRLRTVDQPVLVADASKLRTAIGWKPCYTIEQTLGDMLDLCRQSINSCTIYEE